MHFLPLGYDRLATAIEEAPGLNVPRRYVVYLYARYALSAYVLRVAPSHTPVPDAPSSWEALRAWNNARTTGREPIPVWNGASDSTAWVHDTIEPAVINYAFRAWHDSTHLKHGHDFTRDGERAVALRHLEQVHEDPRLWLDLLDFCPVDQRLAVFDAMQRLLWAETEGQQAYYEKWGAFPEDQGAFAREYVINGAAAALADQW